MQVLRLRTASGFLSPEWFNAVRHGAHRGTVLPSGLVDLRGVEMRLEAGAFAPGEEVEVWIDGTGHFAAARVQDLEAERARQQTERARQEAESAERRRRHLEAALAFNARIALPVAWRPAIKDVLSGLSEHSRGDGCSKATVLHILLWEPLRVGRLQRRAGDFLCTAASGSNGKDWAGRNGQPRPIARVTCKACLRLAARWMRDGDE